MRLHFNERTGLLVVNLEHDTRFDRRQRRVHCSAGVGAWLQTLDHFATIRKRNKCNYTRVNDAANGSAAAEHSVAP